MDLVGLKTTTDNMPKKNNQDSRKQKLQHIADLLRFALTLDDEEIVKSTMESVIELLEEEIGK